MQQSTFTIPLQKISLSETEKSFAHKALDQSMVYPFGDGMSQFRKGLASYFKQPDVLPASSGSAALHLSLMTTGVGPGDIVICPDLNFAAGPNVVTMTGAQPYFVDVERSTFGLDPVLLNKALNELKIQGKHPKAIMAVHAFGLPANLSALVAISEEWKIPLIEDAAGAFGSTYKERPLGTFGDFGATSFNGNKIITTAGGGSLVIKSTDDFARAETIANQGKANAVHYEHTVLGANYRMSNLNAALGFGQLLEIDKRLAKKKSIYQFYRQQINNINGLSMMPDAIDGTSNHWLNVIIVDQTKYGMSAHQLTQKLRDQSIEAIPMWKPMHQQPAFSSYPSLLNGTSSDLFNTALCLPSGIGTTNEDLKVIGETLGR